MRFAQILLTGILMLAASTSQAGLIVLSGDSNLEGAFGNSIKNFYSNMLAGQSVLASPGTDVDQTRGIIFGLPGAGVAASSMTGEITTDNLNGKDWLVTGGDYLASTPKAPLIVDFFNAGGNIFLIGERPGAAAQNNSINAVLQALGSDMRLVTTTNAIGAWVSISDYIHPNPLTENVSELRGTALSEVTGGTPLFDIENTNFTAVAVENLAVSSATVPEPTSLAILSVMGIAACGVRRRSKRANAK